MKDYLQDIVQHTHALGVIDLLKITGTDTGTTVESIAEDRSVILQAQFKNPVPEFVGVFGMPNLGKLNTIINIPEYKEDAKLSITTQKNSQGADVPAGINFENKSGDFKNNYRFMATEVVNDVLKSVTMKSVKWDVEITYEFDQSDKFAIHNYWKNRTNSNDTSLSCLNREKFLLPL